MADCYVGQTRSEGGFKPNKVSAVSVLDYGSQEKDGKTYYTFELLSRTGGIHHISGRLAAHAYPICISHMQLTVRSSDPIMNQRNTNSLILQD